MRSPLARRMLPPGLLSHRPSLSPTPTQQLQDDDGNNTATTNTVATNTLQSLRVPSLPLRTTSGTDGRGGGGSGPNAWSVALGTGTALWRKATRRAGPVLGGGGGRHQGLASGEWGPQSETWAAASCSSNGGGSGGGGLVQQLGPVRQQALASYGSPIKVRLDWVDVRRGA